MIERDIFRKASTTFYPAAQLFPAAIRTDVEKLYSFLRVVDNYVDQPQPDIKNFKEVQDLWNKSSANFSTTPSTLNPKPYTLQPKPSLHSLIVHNMLELCQAYGFNPGWINAFFASMQMDLDNKTYETLDDCLEYMEGSSEVVGLMMARIMGLPKQADKYASLQGRAFQWFNFIRDLEEDLALARCYFPLEDLRKFNLDSPKDLINPIYAQSITNLLRFQIKRYEDWQAEAEKGYESIPDNLRQPLQKAADAYAKTAREIAANPLVSSKT